MIWYGVERLVPADLPRAVGWLARCKIPLVRQHAARRAVTADPTTGLAALVSLLKTTDVEDSVSVDVIDRRPRGVARS